jgi:hypothetical protein
MVETKLCFLVGMYVEKSIPMKLLSTCLVRMQQAYAAMWVLCQVYCGPVVDPGCCSGLEGSVLISLFRNSTVAVILFYQKL